MRNKGVWSQEAYIKSANPGDLHLFGFSLALGNDSLLIGALGEGSSATGIDGDPFDDSAAYSGAIYAFVRSAGNWTQQAYIKASNAQISDQFGQSVAISGGIGVVGANFEDSGAMDVDGGQSSNAAGWAGAAYVFDVSRGASATVRNAGSNPASFAASLPTLGRIWHTHVDLAGTTGHDMAILVGYLTPVNITLGGG